jgi:translation initiation factor 2A
LWLLTHVAKELTLIPIRYLFEKMLTTKQVPIPHSSALAYLGTVKTPSKPVGAYRPPGARGTSTPLQYKREDEGGAAHFVSNGTSLVNTANGFGRPRRQVPGAETVEPPLPPGAAPANTAPETDENLSKAALKNKKKREAKKAKDAEAKAAGLTPSEGPNDNVNHNQNRSPDRRGHERGHERSRSKGFQSQDMGNRQHQNQPARERSHTQGRQNGPSGDVRSKPSQPQIEYTTDHRLTVTDVTYDLDMRNLAISTPQAPPSAVPDLDVTSPGGSSPSAKKIRGLQKKVRAIEDLEMRLAGGEKLEDTQLKKIATKSEVQRELDVLERES